jgi:hypothetical protein
MKYHQCSLDHISKLCNALSYLAVVLSSNFGKIVSFIEVCGEKSIGVSCLSIGFDKYVRGIEFVGR